MKTLGRLITESRTRRGIATQKALAEALRKDQSWVSRLETGAMKDTPSPEDMDALSRTLRLPVREMLQAVGYALDEPQFSDAFPADDPRAEVVRRLRLLDDQDVASVLMLTDMALRHR
jgi:transcriptional regulator with XRE-family HTH domain